MPTTHQVRQRQGNDKYAKTKLNNKRIGQESHTLPDSYKGEAYEMYTNTFLSSQTLKQITVPNGIKKIPTNAFKECKNLTEITLPNTVTSIDANAFNACTALVKVTFNGTKAEFDTIKINSTNSLLINAEIITK